MANSNDTAARLLGTAGVMKFATLLNLAEIVGFWLAAHAVTGSLSVFLWVLFGIGVLTTVIAILVEILSLVAVKALMAQEKLTTKK